MRFDLLNPRFLRNGCFVIASVLLLAGCATTRTAAYDYTAFKQSRPTSILVLPPLNSSPDALATYSMLSQVTLPLAESGYYVFPVSLVDETFHQNGLNSPSEMHSVKPEKLREIFGADTALYIEIKSYGTSYVIISSESRVTASARLVDLRSKQTIWQGSASASSAEGRSSGGGLVGMLVQAVVSQIVEDAVNQSHQVASVTSYRLLAAGMPNGILYGPRSPRYQLGANSQP